MGADEPNRLPLEELHRQAGARFGAFGGWSMPLTYPAGVMKEHQHTRSHAGLFDISHMKLFEISGPDAIGFCNKTLPLDASALPLSHSKYSLLLNEQAGIVDDVILTRLGEARFMLVVNAGNAAADEAHLRNLASGFDVRIVPLQRVFLALQGPEAETALTAAGLDAAGLSFMQGMEPDADWFVTRSGYTGEDGFEIALPESEARNLVEKLLNDQCVMWAGLAARDSLRLEAGLCLHGNDITPDTNPVDAQLMWAIPKSVREHGDFVGAEALRRLVAQGPRQKRVGLKPEGRQPVRAGAELFDADGKSAGRVTSGGFGPSFGHPIAMGYVAAALASEATRLFADVRGSMLPVSVHRLPFTPHRYRKG